METVLVVGNDPVRRNLVIQALNRSNYLVLEASQIEARQIAAVFKGEIHLMIVDFARNDRARADTVTEVALVRPRIRVLMLGETPEAKVAIKFLAERRDFAYLPKAFSPESLIETVLKTLDR